MAAEETSTTIIELTADVVSAYVSSNPVPVGDLPSVISQVYRSLSVLHFGSHERDTEPLKPAVPITKSVTPDFIISLEDGKKFKSLRRHLRTRHNLTPDEYRAKWGLPSNYPMVASNYAALRSAMAKKIGLGRKPKEATKASKTKSRT